jgi:hypothetical protein
VTETRPRPRQDDPTRPQHITQVRTSALRAKKTLDQILHDLNRGRLVRSNGRLIAAEVVVLCEAIALATEAQKDATRQRGESAA